jgi:hypothetical protein
MQTRGYAQRSERLPTDFATVDAAWLTGLLGLRYPGIEVRRMDVVEMIRGHTSKARVTVELNDVGRAAGLPATLCLKANWSGNAMSSPVCVNEARFYHDFRDTMRLPAPVCYFADWDDDDAGQQGLIVLADLLREGAVFDTSARAIGVEAMARSLTGLAALHGGTWDHPELRRHAWLETAMAPQTVTDDYWSMMEETFAAHNRLPERVALFPRWMAEEPVRLRRSLGQLAAQETADTSPLCLVHGDSHLGNTLHLPDGERLWFDWQIVRKGRPWRDYSYFVIGSISIEDRRAHERDLLAHYCAEMGKYGVVLDAARAWDDYRRWVIWGLVAWQSNINPREETMAPLERFCRAADDLNTQEFFDVR